jgi:hypothetical protein
MPANTPMAKILLLRPPTLWHASLERVPTVEQDVSPPEPRSPLEFELGFGRSGLHDIDVLMTVCVNDVPGARLRVGCVASFRLEPATDDADELERQLKLVGTKNAPSVLYPYVREMMAALAQRGGLRPVTLPIINFQDFFSAENAEIPPFNPSTNDQDEAGRSERPDSTTSASM